MIISTRFDMFMASKLYPKYAPDSEYYNNIRKLVPALDLTRGLCVQMAESTPHPRTIKTHLPFSLMADNLLEKSKVY